MPDDPLIGVSTLGGTSKHEDAHELIRRLQGRGAFPDDPDSIRDLENYAKAEIAAVVRDTFDQIAANIFPDLATEGALLETWEAYLRVTNNAARTEAERQARALRFWKLAVAANGVDVLALVEEIATGATIHTPTLATVVAHDCTPETIFHFALKLSDAQFDDPKTRQAFDILARLLPVRNLGHLSKNANTRVQTFTTEDPEWDGAEVLGRSALHNGTTRTEDALRPPARLVDYGPLTRVDAEDLMAIQEAYLVRGVGGQGGSTVAVEGLYRFFAVSLGAGAATEIDTSVDWRDRLATLTCRVGATDIRPGGAAVLDLNDVGNDFVIPLYTGTGNTGAPPSSYGATLDTDLVVRANSVSGVLEIYNNGVGTKYVVGSIWACGDTGER